jgi:hypothetical protein
MPPPAPVLPFPHETGRLMAPNCLLTSHSSSRASTSPKTVCSFGRGACYLERGAGTRPEYTEIAARPAPSAGGTAPAWAPHKLERPTNSTSPSHPDSVSSSSHPSSHPSCFAIVAQIFLYTDSVSSSSHPSSHPSCFAVVVQIFLYTAVASLRLEYPNKLIRGTMPQATHVLLFLRHPTRGG